MATAAFVDPEAGTGRRKVGTQSKAHTTKVKPEMVIQTIDIKKEGND